LGEGVNLAAAIASIEERMQRRKDR
jgi:hypothetical protein